MSVFASERHSPSLDDLEKSLQNVNAMLQSTPPKPVSFTYSEIWYQECDVETKAVLWRPGLQSWDRKSRFWARSWSGRASSWSRLVLVVCGWFWSGTPSFTFEQVNWYFITITHYTRSLPAINAKERKDVTYKYKYHCLLGRAGLRLRGALGPNILRGPIYIFIGVPTV